MGTNLRRSVIALTRELEPTLGFPVKVSFRGPVDTLVDESLARQVAPVIREGLTNVAKHAEAQRARITVAISGERMQIVVEDDGQGGARPGAGFGLRNLRKRAEERGGTVSLAESELGGTELTWEVPVDLQ